MSTIAAIGTAFGRGGIAIIRISGSEALQVAKKMFIPACGCDLCQSLGGRAYYGSIVYEGEKIDDGIATVFRAPKSFTGEDTVEISCHGGILLTERVLKTAFVCGAVPAEAGEFTQRAFLNGKLDLTEAEAVIGLIDAENEEKLRLCASHTSGVLSRRIEELRGELVKLLSGVYVKLDYPEEDLDEIGDDEFRVRSNAVYNGLSDLCKTYKQGKAVSEGVRTALIGKPNTGKSSLLNYLVGEEKAIVTSVAGTTRDVIEEKVSLGRILLRLFDTAGIRDSVDEVERIGIERAIRKADEADLVVALFDTSRPFDNEDKVVVDKLNAYADLGKACIVLLGKNDLVSSFSERELRGLIEPEIPILSVSTVTGDGIEAFKQMAEGFFCEGRIDYAQTAVIANARQYASVVDACEAVGRAINALDLGLGADVCGLDLEAAISALGQVDGRTVTDEIVSSIFHNFCVGK